MVEEYKQGFRDGKEEFLEQLRNNDLSFASHPVDKKDDYGKGFYDGFVLYNYYYNCGMDVFNIKVDQESEISYAFIERTRRLKKKKI